MAQDKFIIFSEKEKTPNARAVDRDGESEPASDVAADGADRRRHPRYRVGVLTEIVSQERGKLPAITFNMSESGALLLTLAPLDPGEEVELSFISDKDQREVVHGRVVHGTELTRDVFWSQSVGIEFTEGIPKFFRVAFVDDPGT